MENKEVLELLKKISLNLRELNRKWTEDGNELKLIEGIVELDKEVYEEIEKLEDKSV